MLGKKSPDLIHARCLTLSAYVKYWMMKISNAANRSTGIQVLHQPIILRRSRRSLVELAGRVQVDHMPASHIKTIIMRHIVPVIKVPGRLISLIFVVPNSRIGNGVEA